MSAIVNRRRYMGKKDMVPIEYIENSGERAYFNSEYVPTGLDVRIVCKFCVVSRRTSVRYSAIVEAYVSDKVRCYRIMHNFGNVNFVVQNARRGNRSSDNNHVLTLGQVYEVDFDHYKYIVNGKEYEHTDYATNIENTAKLLFGDIDNNPNVRFYYLQIFKSGVLVRDLIPVRIGTVGYFYDKVTDTLHGKIGDGNLILGSDVKTKI